ncbi:MAG: aminopeptidase [Candidatus Phytoplasma cynodontis]|nr:MAG: aminopeptidase [Candidatus Phytoplasma cynodontis]
MTKNYHFNVLINKYVDLITKVGVNIQEKQYVFIQSPIICKKVVDLIVKKSYKLGAKKVYCIWENSIEELEKLFLKTKSKEKLSQYLEKFIKQYKKIVKKKGVFINILSPFYQHTKKTLSFDFIKYLKKKLNFFYRYIINLESQWTSIICPNPLWSSKIFPHYKQKDSLKKFWNILFECCLINHNDDLLKAWNKHNKRIHDYTQKLNNLNLKTLFFKNSLGTNISVGLLKDHLWQGGRVKSKNNIYFNPNIPMEEVLSIPDNNKTYGTIVTTKPLVFYEQIIDNPLVINFEKGKIVNFKSKNNYFKNFFQNLINFDQGSSFLGEIALVPFKCYMKKYNKISFFETLIDENSSCHLAIGNAYPATIKNGIMLNKESLIKKKVNFSTIHIDIIFGSEDLSVEGICYKGKKIQIINKGVWSDIFI